MKRRLLWIVLGAAAVYGILCADTVWRARHAYLEGEKAATPQAAYAWYEAAATLFVPPESKWSRLARVKLPEARDKWKAAVRAQGTDAPPHFFE
jgi:hypothetical protein